MSGDFSVGRLSGRVCATIISLLLVGFGAPPASGGVNCVADAAGCCCIGMRGNVDCDYQDLVDIADLTLLIDHLYISSTPLPSELEANVDGEDGIDIADVTRLIDYMYILQTPPAPCPGPVNHPPITILGTSDTGQLFVNVVDPTAYNHGVYFHWRGFDRLDHPYEPPPLRYEWRVYGPYDPTTCTTILHQFFTSIFVTPAGHVYQFGKGSRIITFDTIWISDLPPYPVETCDTLLIDTIKAANAFGTIDTMLDIGAPAFAQNPVYNHITSSSGIGANAGTDTSVSLVNLFRDAPGDSTIQRYFIFWVRAEDADSTGWYDPSPAYIQFQAVDPKFENDILLADAELSYEVNPRNLSRALTYWRTAVQRWNPAATYREVLLGQPQPAIWGLPSLLRNKVIVVVNDDVINGLLTSAEIRNQVQYAMAAGVSIWVCGRAEFFGPENEPPVFHVLPPLWQASAFGLPEGHWSGWASYFGRDPSVRIEDFRGAISLNSPAWPNLMIDTALLHLRYGWGGDYFPPWVDSLASLPEVDFLSPVAEAEILYTYKSLYTGHHPIVPDNFFYDGKPVVYRYDKGYSRIMMSAFTPYAMAGDSVGGAVQVYVDSTLNWLLQPFSATAHSSNRANHVASVRNKPQEVPNQPGSAVLDGGKHQ